MDIESQLVRLIGLAPSILALVIGGILCLSRYWRHPRACALAGIAVAIQLGAIVLLPFVMNFVGLIFPFEGRSSLLVYTVVYSIPDAVSWGLIFWAIFGPEGFERDSKLPWEDDLSQDLDKTIREPR
jgi:hypothetical protein